MGGAGGLLTGYYCLSAALRYERHWVPMLAWDTECTQKDFVPPLDAAFAWCAAERGLQGRGCGLRAPRPRGADVRVSVGASTGLGWAGVRPLRGRVKEVCM